jgi:hypothetical protein
MSACQRVVGGQPLVIEDGSFTGRIVFEYLSGYAVRVYCSFTCSSFFSLLTCH